MVDETESYGLFMSLQGHEVFMDLKEDNLLSVREIEARALFDAQDELQLSLTDFLYRHPSFAQRRISYICLHSKNIQQAEVFWEPEGYTLLRNRRFLDENAS